MARPARRSSRPDSMATTLLCRLAGTRSRRSRHGSRSVWKAGAHPTGDCFSGSSGEPTLAAAAASVPEDQTLDQWRMRMQVGLPEGCMDSAQTAATMLGRRTRGDLDNDLRGRGPPRDQGRRAARGARIHAPVRIADQPGSRSRPRHVELDPHHVPIRPRLTEHREWSNHSNCRHWTLPSLVWAIAGAWRFLIGVADELPPSS